MRRVTVSSAAAVALAVLVSACGGGTRQDANEPSGNFPVAVVQASFPSTQHIAGGAIMRISVRNTGKRAIPNPAVTIDSFSKNSDEQGLADASRPLWIIQHGPRGGDTAYDSTWAFGRPLAPGRTRTFEWQVTPVVPGTRTVRWVVAAGLNDKARARTASGERPHGSFTVNVSGTPAADTVNPDTGAVVSDGG